MPSPKPTKHPTDNPPGFEVIRIFEPDHDRQVGALVRLLETTRTASPTKENEHGEEND